MLLFHPRRWLITILAALPLFLLALLAVTVPIVLLKIIFDGSEVVGYGLIGLVAVIAVIGLGKRLTHG